MSRSRPVTARVRILAAILAVACVGLSIVGSVTFIVQREQVLTEIDQRLGAQVARLVTVATPTPSPAPTTEGEEPEIAVDPLAVGDYDDLEEYLTAAVARLVPARNEGAVAVIDGVARYRPSTLSGFDISANRTLIDRAVAETTGGDTVRGTVVTDTGALRYVAIPVTVEGDDRSGLYIRAVDLGAELDSVTTAMATFSIAAIAVIVAIGVVGWFVTGRLLSPIRHMRETADAIAITDLSMRLPAGGTDDIADLSRTVNSMLDRIEGTVDVQRQLLDDVRHELKTPITIVRGHLELMDPKDAVDVATTREIGISELDRLARLVEDIDLLAAAEGDSYVMRDVDLAALTSRVAELVAVIPGHTWSIESHAGGIVHGDQDRLLQAWLQLADNAAKYTPEGTPIEVGSSHDAAGTRLWVRDHGPGIPPAARRRIFRRFDRAGGKRVVGGSGLGLAIVEAITTSHGGTCTVTDTRGGGATFTIHLPPSRAELPAPVRAGDVVLQREASG
ncbi:signal transduction histidine kinase [Microbacterium terrae]|uniref:histidine kinase n=1 Tax=Microbacterium terrae TaxID=69369 RepID=A0A0M2H7B9_9MICO|nr:HAMP domain-containing sensor histidine kinase [Microbacterium terrae]KJL39973.1 Signal transduction histidine-protein kinase/phosphatase MprB [Microbacterium terrae]MBP1076912.1 signal transduction histidine kinase [Microbacterium terrae]GLJ99507.1 two-component sensor histidine kinase [Microbacterium terrae]